MHDAARVGGAERARDLAHDAQRIGHRDRPDTRETLIERLALEQLHHDVRAAIGVVAVVEDLHDPRIGDRSRRTRLVEEPRHDFGPRRELVVQHFDSRAATEHRVLGEPHLPHTAFTNAFDDAVWPNLRAFNHPLQSKWKAVSPQQAISHAVYVRGGSCIISLLQGEVMRRSAVLGVVVLAACGGKSKLDSSDMEAKIAAEAKRLVGIDVASVKCPKDIAAKTGSTFSCDVTFAGGGALAFKVDQVDASGALSVAPVGDWLLGDKMAQDLKTELFLIGHEDAVVECGDAVIPIQVPSETRCTVKNAGTTATEVIVMVDRERNVDWKLAGGS